MNFDSDIHEGVLRILPYNHDVESELQLKQTHELLIIYFNWLNRLIPQCKRSVYVSARLRTRLDQELINIKPNFDEIKSKIIGGNDLTPYLSEDIKTGYQKTRENQSYKNRKDLDLLLNDWGIHHLHVSHMMNENGNVRKGNLILFAIFQKNNAYLIDILEHRKWANIEIVETIVNEWPNIGVVHELKGAFDLSRSYNDQERLTLRNNGMNAPMEINGKLWIVVEGLSTAGTSMKATNKASQLLNNVKRFNELIESRPNYIAEQIQKNGLKTSNELSLKFAFHRDQAGIFESNSGIFFKLFSN